MHADLEPPTRRGANPAERPTKLQAVSQDGGPRFLNPPSESKAKFASISSTYTGHPAAHLAGSN
jgi:hypothetical protein